MNLILMTSLVPTTGHADIINFALGIGPTQVIVCGRSHEPVSLWTRVKALKDACPDAVIIPLMNDDAPQNPSDHPDFWRWWAETIRSCTVAPFDRLIASEGYGVPLAEALGVDFMTYDIARVMNQTKSTDVRDNPLDRWDQMLPLVREEYCTRVTLFGQESVGKSTHSHMLAQSISGQFLPEYAREYLETVGSEVTVERMSNITMGQMSLQRRAGKDARYPFIIQDTDLYSTIGYYRIMGEKPHEKIENYAAKYASDMYFVMPDDIPFEEDILRYGGTQRESAMGFWIDLLEEYGLPYEIVPQGSIKDKQEYLKKAALRIFAQKWNPIQGFVRE